MEQPKKLQLSDVLPYEADNYYTEDELKWIKSTFKDKRAVKIMRKVFIPTFHDGDMPLEEMKADLWFADRDWSQIPVEQFKTLAVARIEAMKFIMNGLVKLKVIASLKEEDSVEAAYKRSKDSAK